MTLRTVALAGIAISLVAAACGGGGVSTGSSDVDGINQAQDWVQFSSVEGGFSALFPGQPVEERKTEVTEYGDLDFTQFLYVDEDGTEYLVMYADASGLTSVFTTDEMLDALAPRLVRGASGELIRELVIDIDGYPGRDVKVRVADGSILRMQGYLVGNRNYQVAVVTSSEDQFSASVNRFLNSFAIEALAVEPTGGLNWERFVSRAGGYSFLAPHQPEVETLPSESSFGTIEYTQHVMSVGSILFITSYSDLAAENVETYTPAELVGFAAENMAERTSGRVLFDEAISLNGMVGREVRIEAQTGRIFRQRIYQAGVRQFVIGSVSDPADQSSAEVETFLDSFKLE